MTFVKLCISSQNNMRNHKTIRILLVGFTGVLTLVITEAVAQSKTSSTSAKTAGEAYKNIQVLKDAPAEQLVPAMQFISASLGVGCDHCHVQGAFEKDDKKGKQTARKMMQMTLAINQNNFDGHQEVTCYSCHRGGAKPISIPIISDEVTSLIPPPPPTAPADLPSGNNLVEKYIQALGGMDALKKVSSRVEKGKASSAGREYPVDILAKSPAKGLTVTHLPDGDLASAYSAQSGWQLAPGRPTRELTGTEIDGAKIDSSFYFPVHLTEILSEFETTGIEKIDAHSVFAVRGRQPNQLPIRLFFDQESGLLVRQIRYEPTPLGRIPVQTDFSDYRDTNGVKVPYQRITSRPGRRLVTKIDSVEQNIKLEDSKFEKPPNQSATGQQTSSK